VVPLRLTSARRVAPVDGVPVTILPSLAPARRAKTGRDRTALTGMVGSTTDRDCRRLPASRHNYGARCSLCPCDSERSVPCIQEGLYPAGLLDSRFRFSGETGALDCEAISRTLPAP